MKNHVETPPTILVIFGAGGDLTWRKLVPALYNLFLDDLLPHRFALIGLDRKEISEEEFRNTFTKVLTGFPVVAKPTPTSGTPLPTISHLFRLILTMLTLTKHCPIN